MRIASFRDRIAGHAGRHPDREALVSDAASISYGRLAHDVERFALALRERVGAPGTVVALTLRGEVEHLVATLALFALGVPSVALASHDAPAARARLAHRVGATVLVADRMEDAVEGLRFVDVATIRAAAAATRATGALPAAAPHEHALYLTGSGTTGEPKIIAYAERELAAQAIVLAGYADKRMLRPAHVEYNNSKRRRLYALWHGATSVLADGTPGSLRDVCIRQRATWLELSPLHAAGLVLACRAEGPLPAGFGVRIGGARAPASLRRAVLDAVTPELHVTYAATEAAHVTVAGPGMHDHRETVGLPMAGVTVEVVRTDGSVAASDEVGEIRIRTPGMATGYVGDAAATARHFRDGWFVPGDLASFTRDGQLVIHGRADDMMIMNSINIFPLEIERILESHPAVESAAAFPLASPMHGQIPVAAVELRGGASCTPAELIAYARDLLGVRAPRRVEVLATLPRNPQGKVMKRALAERYAHGES